MTEIGTIIDGKYRILEEIGRGGMSYVYLARDSRLNQNWAIKEIRKQGSGKNDEIVINSLLAEANLMKRLDHPALPRIVDIIDNGQTMYIVMDFIEGQSLDKVLKEYGAQTGERVLEWAKQLCDALSYLHSQKPPIIYRDMKPANIMLKPDGNLKVIDFGIAREVKEQNLADTWPLGSPGYAPPEQYQGHTDVRSDIYALGMTLHYLLTGADPQSVGYKYKPVREWNLSLSKEIKGIEAIIDKCTEAAPENRYQNCAELMYDLEHPDELTKEFRKRQKRKLRTFIAATALCLCMAASGIVCRLTATAMNDRDYEKNISKAATKDDYKKAIEIYPGRTEAYLKLLEKYQEDGKFVKQENDEFLGLYRKNEGKFNTESADFAELNYQIGLMYYNFYTENDDESIGDHVNAQKAYPFFKENYNNDELKEKFDNQAYSDCYYQICLFYKTYVAEKVKIKEATADTYTEILEEFDTVIDQIESSEPYDQLVLYRNVLEFLKWQSNRMAAVGVDETEVLELMEKVYDRAGKLKPQVSNDKSIEEQERISLDYEKCKKDIEDTYDNREKLE